MKIKLDDHYTAYLYPLEEDYGDKHPAPIYRAILKFVEETLPEAVEISPIVQPYRLCVMTKAKDGYRWSPLDNDTTDQICRFLLARHERGLYEFGTWLRLVVEKKSDIILGPEGINV